MPPDTDVAEVARATLVAEVTDLYVDVFGDAVRDNTMVLVDEWSMAAGGCVEMS